MSLEDLYRDVILDHYRNPRHREPLTDPDATAEGVNPLCGDEVKVELAFDGDRLTDISVRGQGCSISQVAAPIISMGVNVKSRDEIDEIASSFFEKMPAHHETAAGLASFRPGSVLAALEVRQG